MSRVLVSIFLSYVLGLLLCWAYYRTARNCDPLGVVSPPIRPLYADVDATGISAPREDDVPVDHSTGGILVGWRRQEFGDQALPVAGDRLEDEILTVEWLACKKELTDSLVDLSGHIEVEMGRPRARGVEGIGSRLDGREPEPAFSIGELDAVTLKARIEWRGIRIGWMVVATEGVGLPEFNAGASDQVAPLVEYPPINMNDLPLSSDAAANYPGKVSIPVKRLHDGIKGAGGSGWCRRQCALAPTPQQAARHPDSRYAGYYAEPQKLSPRDSPLICLHPDSPPILRGA
jgi:hypothetical protein